ncbi:MAG: YCF48-related protein [Cellvibrionaceae bacterium]|nr:YCF48-related protein [Cellvibrionaceae bacterium]MCV6627477.1 YCF48-related protein [Cellvibrionaceae bacterium]
MKKIARAASLLLLCQLLPQAAAAKDYDVLDLPAQQSELAPRALVYSVSPFHGKLYAAGQTGHILHSDDSGKTWQQSQVPVSSAIVDIHFPSPEKGWAVGHEGVILHSADAGKTWQKQYDGLRYGQEGLAYYKALAEQYPGQSIYGGLVGEMEFSIEQGADKPFFKVYFADDNNGYALGAYGMAVVTQDGGQTWQHNLHVADNDSLYHVFDFAQTGSPDTLLLCGEAGLLSLSNVREGTTKQLENSPWDGSFFSCAVTKQNSFVVAGLRGRIFHSGDNGQTWAEAKKPPSSTIVDTLQLADGRLLAAGIGGEILVSNDDGRSFNYLPIKTNTRAYAIADAGNDKLLVAGPAGVQSFDLGSCSPSGC